MEDGHRINKPEITKEPERIRNFAQRKQLKLTIIIAITLEIHSND